MNVIFIKFFIVGALMVRHLLLGVILLVAFLFSVSYYDATHFPDDEEEIPEDNSLQEHAEKINGAREKIGLESSPSADKIIEVIN